MMQASRSSFEPSPLANPLPALRAVSPSPRRETTAAEKSALAELQALRDRHAFWDSSLFAACAKGSLSREDFRFVFSQYTAIRGTSRATSRPRWPIATTTTTGRG